MAMQKGGEGRKREGERGAIERAGDEERRGEMKRWREDREEDDMEEIGNREKWATMEMEDARKIRRPILLPRDGQIRLHRRCHLRNPRKTQRIRVARRAEGCVAVVVNDLSSQI